MRQSSEQLENLDIQVAVVTFDADFMARAYVEQTQLPWPLLIDSQRTLYRTYGMERIGWWAIYGPASIWRYLKLVFLKGRRIEKGGSDYRQVGGDVLVDPHGTVRFHYVSTAPHDRPSVQDIIDARLTDT